MRPIVLDFDGAVLPLPGELRVPLGDWQETIRFGCTRRAFARLEARLAEVLPASPDAVFTGSGDYHHVSVPLIARAARRQPCRVLVFDNHPDNMRYLFGIHCGSWVRYAARLPGVAHVDVVGITSHDVGAGALWENYLAPLYAGRVTYWTVGTRNPLAAYVGLRRAYRVFESADALTDALVRQIASDPAPTYVSIDKDVLHTDVVRTNWDQGVLRTGHIVRALEAVGAQRTGLDVTGEVSAYTYRAAWKRWLSARDAQPETRAADAAAWQRDQQRVNRALLDAASAAVAAGHVAS
jgi:arginase family enzyme